MPTCLFDTLLKKDRPQKKQSLRVSTVLLVSFEGWYFWDNGTCRGIKRFLPVLYEVFVDGVRARLFRPNAAVASFSVNNFTKLLKRNFHA